MAELEYRVMGDEEENSLVYEYEEMEEEGAALRFLCDYLVKGSRVYETVSTEVEPGRKYVIWVREADDEEVVSQEVVVHPKWSGFRVEVREFKESGFYYPVVHTLHFQHYSEVLLCLTSSVLHIEGAQWEKTSVEIDENRKVFVFYAIPMKEDA